MNTPVAEAVSHGRPVTWIRMSDGRETLIARAMRERRERLNRLADWINEHDDGSPTPRACVTPHGTVRMLCTGWDYSNDYTSVTEHEVSTLSEARALLGY